MEDKEISEQESLKLITDMISRAKAGFHESGTSAILWGSVVAFCGLASFVERMSDFRFGFDIWLLALFAIIPQIFITIRERRSRKAISHMEAAMNAIWLVYGISIFALVFYFNTVPTATDRIVADEGFRIIREGQGKTQDFHYGVLSPGSLLLILYAIPTLATGLAHKFRPMIVGAVLCYVFFIISCFVPESYDMLLNGLAGIFNWLIPGLILRRCMLRGKKAGNV